MKIFYKFILLIFFSIFSAIQNNPAQNISAVPNINPYPSPYTTDWETNPAALGSVSLFNNSNSDFQVKLRVRISLANKGIVFISTSNILDLKSFSSLVVNNTEITKIENTQFPNSDLKNQIQQTGRLPEGNYTACFDVLNLNDIPLISNTCANFTIIYPEPPHIIYPSDNYSLQENNMYPVFQWTPVIVPPDYQIRYILKICEVLQGQTLLQALSSNVPIFEDQNILTSTLVYPISAQPLEKDKKYVWQVQVLDQYNYPPTKNDGKSEIFTFQYEHPKQPENELSLVEPANNSILKNKTPKFSWESKIKFGQRTKYKITIVEILQGQSLQTAIKNYPVYTTTASKMNYTPASPLPLSALKNYAWQIQAIEYPSGSVIASSEIWKFNISQLQLISPTANQYLNMKKPKLSWIYQSETGKYYDLKIVQLPMILTPSFNINNLFNNGPYLYRNSTISGKDYSITNSPNLEIISFTTPNDLPLNTGVNYAWRVEEKDSPYGTVNSTSEIRYFKFDPYQAGFATNCQVTGNLFYEFADPGEYVIWPLKNINIKLVTKYILKYDSYDGQLVYYDINGKGHSNSQGEIELKTIDLPYEYRLDNQKTVAIAKLNDNGFFSLSLMNIKPMGVVNNNYTLSGGGGEFKYSYHGKLYRVLRMIVQSPYYTSPNTDIILQPGETKNYSQLIAYARSYQLTVNVKTPGSYWNNQFLSGNANLPKMIVYLLRKTRPNEVPENDGLPRPINPDDKPLTNFEVVGRKISDQYGNAIFKRLVKNVHSQNDEYWIWATVDSNQTSLLYRMWLPVEYNFKYPNDKAVYNDDYKYPGVSKNVIAFPLNPLVKGKIKRQDGGQPIVNAKVKLLDYAVFWWQEEAHTLTNSSGKFWFNNLKNVFDSNGNPTGPVRGIKISKYGFRDTTLAVKSGAILKPGESWNREVLLQPDSKIKGKIVDEYGNGITADVTVEGGETVKAIAPFILSMPGYKISPASFEIRAPKGIVKIKFDPTQYNPSYLMKDTIIYVSGSIKDMGTIVIRKALHRMKIFAGDASKASGEFYYITSKLAGAKVRLKTNDGKLIGEKLTNSSGYAEFTFANASKLYSITVSAPKNQDFETGQIVRYNNESEYPKTYPIFLKPASHIEGYVYVGTQNLPVGNAHIWLDYSSSGLSTETYSDSSGFYKLSNVPIGNNIVKASKKSSNLIGDQKSVNVPQVGLSNINLNLKVYSEMDITHLLGFPIEVDSLVEQSGEVKISGKFVDLDQLNNNYFKSNSSSLKFSNVAIEPHPTLSSVIFGKTVPVAKPKVLPLKTDDNTLSINVYDNYSGSLIDKNIGVELASNISGKGVIKGKVFVSQSSFNIPSTNIGFTNNGFYLKESGSNELNLPAITPDKSNPLTTNKFDIVDENGKAIKYLIYGYSADGEVGNSFLYKDSVTINTTIHTDITGMSPSDINLNIGKITFTQNAIKPLYNQTNKISYSLGQWKVDLTKWSFKGYLSAANGSLKTNVVDIPITSMVIKPDELSSAVFNFSSMSLGGVVPLNIIGSSMFGYEKVSKNWFLTVDKGNNQYAASFSGLPGMVPGDKIYIASFSLYSDGIKNFSPQGNKIKIYKVATLSPDQVIAGDNQVEITSLTFNIPKVGQLGAAIHYYKESGKIKFKLLPVKIAFSINDVNLAFAEDVSTYPEILDANGLRTRGRIYEDGKYNLKAWLYHTVDSTSVWVETPSSPFANNPPWQRINVGSAANYLDKIAGGMRVIDNNTLWDTLRIAGDLITPSGIKKGQNRMSFTVTGDWIANGQEVGINNINTPFGDMSWTYDFDESKLRGTMNLNQDIGGVTLVGPIETVVDGTGWYFFGAIKMKVPGIPEAGAAMIIGDYPTLPQTVKDGFTSVSYNKNLPCYFHSQIKGFLFSGHAAVPVIIPSIDVNAVIASIHFGVEAGANVRIWSGFDGNGSQYGLGALAYLHAYFTMDAITCTELSADAKLELGFEGIYQTNPSMFTLNGCGGFSINGTVKQKGVGIGDFCTPPNITVFDEGIGMHADIQLKSSGDISLSFGKGACSAANAAPCN